MAARGTNSSKSSDSKETEAKVSKYEDRPYSEAISEEHRKTLKGHGVTVADAASASEVAPE